MKITFKDDAGTVLREVLMSVPEFDAMATDMLDVTEWITNAFQNKSRQCVDYIVEQSGRGSKNTPVADKLKIIADLKKENSDLLKTGKQKNEEAENKLKE